jgi:tetratricopeptide (TPR) repeat protein
MSIESYWRITDWYDELWQSNRKDDHTELIRWRLQENVDESSRLALEDALKLELIRCERYDEAIDLIKQRIVKDPNDLQSRISLASAYLYYKENPVAALKYAEIAYKFSKKQNLLRRHALSVLARTSKVLGRYSLLEKCIREIMVTAPSEPFDAGIEADFVEGLPAEVLSKELLDKFADFIRKSKLGKQS